MAKVDKEYQIRMEGYVAALRFAKEYGLNELEKDVKRRGFLRMPIHASKKEMERFIEYFTENMHQTMLTVFLRVLHDSLGFRKKRLQKFKILFDEAAERVLNFDYLGNHYVKLEDYAREQNEKYDLGLNIDRIAACQDSCEHERNNAGRVKINDVIQRLYEKGFDEAAAWLESRVD